MSNFGRENIRFGRPLRGRHEAWIHRRSPRLVPLLLRAQARTDRTAAAILKPGDNDNTAGQAAPTLPERHDWEPSLAIKQGTGSV